MEISDTTRVKMLFNVEHASHILNSMHAIWRFHHYLFDHRPDKSMYLRTVPDIRNMHNCLNIEIFKAENLSGETATRAKAFELFRNF